MVFRSKHRWFDRMLPLRTSVAPLLSSWTAKHAYQYRTFDVYWLICRYVFLAQFSCQNLNIGFPSDIG